MFPSDYYFDILKLYFTLSYNNANDIIISFFLGYYFSGVYLMHLFAWIIYSRHFYRGYFSLISLVSSKSIFVIILRNIWV